MIIYQVGSTPPAASGPFLYRLFIAGEELIWGCNPRLNTEPGVSCAAGVGRQPCVPKPAPLGFPEIPAVKAESYQPSFKALPGTGPYFCPDEAGLESRQFRSCLAVGLMLGVSDQRGFADKPDAWGSDTLGPWDLNFGSQLPAAVETGQFSLCF